MTIKTFRGLIANDGQDTIVLHTNNGSMGYRILKFQIMTEGPGTNNGEHIVKIYKVPQAANIPGGTNLFGHVDFSDNTLLGCALTHDYTSAYQFGWTPSVIFDQEIFNQDIYVTATEGVNGLPINYYIELEQIKLDLSENTVATLKDIRNLS